jgi:hypothetical protein
VPGAAAPAAAAATNPGKPDLSLPKDASKEWLVGIAVFSANGLSPENAYLSYSLPLLIKNEVNGLDTHAYQDDEADLTRKAIITREITVSRKAVTSVKKEQDALLFNEVSETDPARSAVAARLSAAAARLAFLESLEPARIELTLEKPVTFKEGTGAGKLLAAPNVPPAVYCAQQGIDLLVGGSIQEVQGYLLLDVWAFDPLTGSNVFSFRNAASRDELYAALPGFGREVARTILGRAWSLVAFAPSPPDSALYVDGVLVASGASPALYLSPGQHEIRMAATGFRDVTRTISLDAEQEARIDDSLEKIAEGQVAITSDPPGADLYVDSFWKGKTPVTMDRPAQRSRGVLTSTGFYALSFPLDPDSAASLSFPLQKDVGTRDVRQTQARDEFYVSLGFFAFSIPIPLFSYALSIDFAVRTLDYQGQGLYSSAAQSQTESLVFQGVYYVGIAVSAALFTWMVTRIMHYVKVTDEIAG